MHTWVASRHVRPHTDDVFVSQRRRPLLDFAEDGAGGVHDMLLAACDTERYRQLGVEGDHRSCAENLREAMRELSLEIPVVPQPVNFFANTSVEPDGTMVAPPNRVRPERTSCSRLAGARLRRVGLPVRPPAARLDGQRRGRPQRASRRAARELTVSRRCDAATGAPSRDPMSLSARPTNSRKQRR